MPTLTRVYPSDLTVKFPLAIAALGLTEDEVEATDYNFYVVDEKLFCESHDEQMAFQFVGGEWTVVRFPLKRG